MEFASLKLTTVSGASVMSRLLPVIAAPAVPAPAPARAPIAAPLPPPAKTADQGACASAATDESGSALAFTRRLLTINARIDGITGAADRDGLQRNAKTCRTLKFARRLGIGDRATYLRSSRDRSDSSDRHGIGQRPSEPLSSCAVL